MGADVPSNENLVREQGHPSRNGKAVAPWAVSTSFMHGMR